jgi:hypothetical protein
MTRLFQEFFNAVKAMIFTQEFKNQKFCSKRRYTLQATGMRLKKTARGSSREKENCENSSF